MPRDGADKVVGAMPKEKISDPTQTRWFTEVSWRPEEHVCGCGNIWSGAAAECLECDRQDVPVTSGHVQIGTVNRDSPFEFPEVATEGHWQAAEPFDGWRCTLDADGIDRAIAALKKARKQAYPWQKDSPPSQTINVHVSAPAGQDAGELARLVKREIELQARVSHPRVY